MQSGVCGPAPHPGLPQQNDGGHITTLLPRPHLHADSSLQHRARAEHLSCSQAAVYAGGRPDLAGPHLPVQVRAGHTECELLSAGVSVRGVQAVGLLMGWFVDGHSMLRALCCHNTATCRNKFRSSSF